MSSELDTLLEEPERVAELTADRIESYLSKLLIKLRSSQAVSNPVLVRFDSSSMDKNTELIIVGDTHGDFVITTEIVKTKFLSAPETTTIVLLGDYIDRTPLDIRPFGAINNITYLLLLKLRYFDNVTLLRGNHEAFKIIECYPYEFNKDLILKFGTIAGNKLHELFCEVFAELPLMFITSNGLFGAHGGIYKPARELAELMTLDRNNYEVLNAIVWSDPIDYGPYRGPVGDNFNAEELETFLKRINANVMVRGHDYTTLGYAIYNNRCLTLFSSRYYASRGNGGILIARVRLDEKLRRATDIRVEDFSTGKWRPYKIQVL